MRRRVVQQAFRFKPARDGSKRGGARPGSGRPPTSDRIRHRSRTPITRQLPVHVTMRLGAGLASLRTHKAFRAIRHATRVVAAKRDARIIHISVQRNHIHMLVEANDAVQLGEGMRRFAISAARQLNAAADRSGQVFPDRYHAEVITVPRQARHALAYVLNNWRRHGIDQGHGLAHWVVDPFSSASEFRDWSELPRGKEWDTPRDYEPLAVQSPGSWLLRDGWRRYGRPSIREIPGPRSLSPGARGRTTRAGTASGRS